VNEVHLSKSKFDIAKKYFEKHEVLLCGHSGALADLRYKQPLSR
jgi:hypothetical protein